MDGYALQPSQFFNPHPRHHNITPPPLPPSLLTKLLARGHKVLIFSQMVRMLDLIEVYLSQSRVPSCRLDGSTTWQERRDAMKAFNERGDIKVFLLSTRAGGLGINLTGADTVIFYDSVSGCDGWVELLEQSTKSYDISIRHSHLLRLGEG